jgi:hypothetical protein
VPRARAHNGEDGFAVRMDEDRKVAFIAAEVNFKSGGKLTKSKRNHE